MSKILRDIEQLVKLTGVVSDAIRPVSLTLDFGLNVGDEITFNLPDAGPYCFVYTETNVLSYPLDTSVNPARPNFSERQPWVFADLIKVTIVEGVDVGSGLGGSNVINSVRYESILGDTFLVFKGDLLIKFGWTEHANVDAMVADTDQWLTVNFKGYRLPESAEAQLKSFMPIFLQV